jgi:hypothetical protein
MDVAQICPDDISLDFWKLKFRVEEFTVHAAETSR